MFYKIVYVSICEAIFSTIETTTTKGAINIKRDFYFCALTLLVVLSFPHLVSFSQFSPSPCLKPLEGARMGGFPFS
jgi:hypothetical protein